MLRSKYGPFQSPSLVRLVVVKVPKLFNESTVINLLILLSIARYEVAEELRVVLLQILGELASAVNHRHEILDIQQVFLIGISGEAIYGNVLKVLLQEEFPLVKWPQLLMQFHVALHLSEELAFV